MMTSINSNRQRKEVDAAMAMHIHTLHDAGYDALSALLGILLGILSFIHAAVRVVFAIVGLITWTLGVWLVGLKALRAYCIEKSSTSLFREEVQDE